MIPDGVKRTAHSIVRRYRLRRAVLRLLKLRRGEVPSRDLLEALYSVWGNEGYTARVPYLSEVASLAAVSQGPILECGSGLTTILLGVLAARYGVVVHTLEHSAEWHGIVDGFLRKHRIRGVQLHLVPIVDRGPFAWYRPPADGWPVEFRLVICDGPPGETKGGRYGLLPVVGPRLSAGAIILLDDATRPSEARILERWQRERQLKERVHEAAHGSFAVLTLGHHLGSSSRPLPLAR